MPATVVVLMPVPAKSWNEMMVRFVKSNHAGSKRPHQLCIMLSTIVLQFSWEPIASRMRHVSTGRESFKSTFGYLKSMCALKNGHAWLNLGVNRCQQASNLDRNKVLGNKQHFLCTCTVVEVGVTAVKKLQGS